MNRKTLQLLVLLALIGVIGYAGFSTFVAPYFALPQQDRVFLAAHPKREDVLRHFGPPAEELRAGERFPMTGWHPLPMRAASFSAVSFVRRYGGKVYVFFNERGEMEEFVISNS